MEGKKKEKMEMLRKKNCCCVGSLPEKDSEMGLIWEDWKEQRVERDQQALLFNFKWK